MRAALYARVSTRDQQTLGLQVEATAVYIKGRGWDLVRQGKDVGSARRSVPAGRAAEGRAARSMSWWSGGWTAGAGRCPTWC